jgi:hypothetical protein
MKKLYIVISSWDNYDDHYKVNELCCSSISFAEKMKTALETQYRRELDFPFDWCTKDEFFKLCEEGKAVEKDIEYFIQWEDERNRLQTFNNCFINEIDFYDEI